MHRTHHMQYWNLLAAILRTLNNDGKFVLYKSERKLNLLYAVYKLTLQSNFHS